MLNNDQIIKSSFSVEYTHEGMYPENYLLEVFLHKLPIETDQVKGIKGFYDITNKTPGVHFYIGEPVELETIVHESMHVTLDFFRRIGLSIGELTKVQEDFDSLGEELVALYQWEFIEGIKKIIDGVEIYGRL
jgi:hypothetical protein